MRKTKVKSATDRSITIDHVVDAPRELVFKVFTDPEHIDQWWGPDGFTNTTKEMDVRPGGVWRYTMHAPDGTDFPNLIEYTEVSPPERLVFWHSDDGGDEGMKFESVVTFTEESGGTRVTLMNTFPTREVRDMVVRDFNAIEAGKQTLARFAGYVEQVAADSGH